MTGAFRWNMQLIKLGKFSESWGALQDCLDYLSTVRRFSEIDICAFEDQLVELEKTYPYNIFLSAGLIVDAYECTLCGQDINSLDCIHRMGHLYRGQVAQAKPRKILQLSRMSGVPKAPNACVSHSLFLVQRTCSPSMRRRSSRRTFSLELNSETSP